MDQALDLFEKHWLKDRPYMAGEKISIADIVGACEVEQPSKQIILVYPNCFF